jgi:hypothetical protein
MTETTQAETQDPNIPDAPDEKPEKVLAKDVIEELMLMWRDKIPKILRHLIDNASKQGKPVEALRLFNSLKEASEHALDAAHKLVSFQTPKLESVAVRNEITHQFVIRAPNQIGSVDEWMKKTGAERLTAEQFTPQGQNPQTFRPSHAGAESEEEHSIEDERQTFEALNEDTDIIRAPNIKITKTKN